MKTISTAQRAATTPATADDLPTPDAVIAVGVDPGATTALVALSVPIHRPRWASGPAAVGTGAAYDVDAARWLGSVVVRTGGAKALSIAEQKLVLFERARDAVRGWAPQVVALEEPLDAGDAWENAGRRDGRRQQRDTQFLLGEHYGLALAAARVAVPAARVASYPVNNHGARPGWMQGGAPRPRARAAALVQLRYLARALGAPAETLDTLSEDECMALGVLLFHLQTSEPPTAARPSASDDGRRRTRAVELAHG